MEIINIIGKSRITNSKIVNYKNQIYTVSNVNHLGFSNINKIHSLENFKSFEKIIINSMYGKQIL